MKEALSAAFPVREPECPFESLGEGETPLIYRTAQNAVYGKRHEYAGGCITDALFVYLEGEPSEESIRVLDETYRGRPLVCMSAGWEAYIRKHYPDAQVYTRYMMKPAHRFRFEGELCLPDGYRVALFDRRAFERHPFSHGKQYLSFSAFQTHGAGAVVWHNDQIAASASSFITLEKEVEMDVSAKENHRGKGLATACVRLMLEDCARRGITVHWDAQNEISKHLAEKFGFEMAFRYRVYCLPK